MTTSQLWQAVLAELEISLSRANFSTWLQHTALLECQGEKAVIAVPSLFIQNWIEKKYHASILKTLQSLTGGKIKELVYSLQKKATSNTNAEISFSLSPKKTLPFEEEPKKKNVSIEPNLNSRYIFDNFIVGKNNELAHAAAQAVADQPGEKYNPLFLYGGVGLGKTHLLQAIGHFLAQQGKEILYTTSENFTNQYVLAIRTHSIEQFRKKFRSPKALLIDDIQFFSGKEGTQEEFFHTYNALHETNRQLVISSDRLPRLIPSLENRLISRFESGMIADVSMPDLETRMAILKAKCKEKNININDQLLPFIAEAVRENVRELEGALNKIVAYHDFYHLTPSPETIKQVLATLSPSRTKKTTPRKILEAISEHYELSPEELKGISKTKKIAFPRQLAMFLMRDCLNMSFGSIGQELGKRDHTTVMYACEKIGEESKRNDGLLGEINLIKQKMFNLS